MIKIRGLTAALALLAAPACATVSLVPAAQTTATVSLAASNEVIERSNEFTSLATSKGWVSKSPSLLDFVSVLAFGEQKNELEDSDSQSSKVFSLNDFQLATREVELLCAFASSEERSVTRRGLIALERALVTSMSMERNLRHDVNSTELIRASEGLAIQVQCLRSELDKWALHLANDQGHDRNETPPSV